MTPQEKAEDILDKCYGVEVESVYFGVNHYLAKKFALIVVDEMILVLPFTDTNYSLNEYAIHLQKYLEQVKQEIEKPRKQP